MRESGEARADAAPTLWLRGRATRAEAALILALAIALGGFIRFLHLGAAEITGDEAVSWVTASAPTLAGVIGARHGRNPGTLALHDLILHLWILMFGQSETALRSLSALFGTAAIALVFFVAYELLMLPAAGGDGCEADAPAAEVTAALSAFITAISLVMINSSREARMYSMTLALVLAQAGLFLRGTRRGGWPNFAGLAVFTALALAANFTAAFAFGAEGAWFAWRFVAERRRGRRLDMRAWRAAFGVLTGFALLAPFAPVVASQLGSGVEFGEWSWIAPPRLLDPLQTFESASGAWVFVLLAALAMWAVLSRWRSRPDQIAFALIWMWLPALVQLAISYLFRPMDVTRYVLSSFIGFYILAALGIAALGGVRARSATAGLLALTMLAHVYQYDRKPRDRQFREAVALATRAGPGRERLGVVSWDGSNGSALYYAPPERRDDLVRLPPNGDVPADAPQIRVVILPSNMPPGALARYRALYPRLEGSFRRVEVRAK
ncbi:MAG: glycosyltransferase family 39 protein [Candidatus Binatus sp.]